MDQAPGIDFTKLSLKDALDLAVLVEEEARDAYAAMAESLRLHHTAEAAAFFEKMVKVEELHRSQLAERRKQDFGDAPSAVHRGMIFDVEAPDFDQARAFMTHRAALLVALKSEQKAHNFFASALHAVTDPTVQALFSELRDEETEHLRLVKVEIEKAAPSDPGKPEDYSDDPIAL